MMLHHILKTLRDHCYLDFNKPVVVGVSGGSDSLCLLYVLHEIGYPLIVAHYNHHIREEADQEALRVKCWVEGLGLPYVYSERETTGNSFDSMTEENARQKRYEFLFETAKTHRAQAVAVAHNADDQVETVLMHLLRGSGLTGLTGMAYYTLPNSWSQEIPLVRPLLATWRKGIDEFINARNLSPNIDHSNFDVKIYRNRIRHELIPYLESFSPQIKSLLWQTADILSDEERMIESSVNQAWQHCYIENDNAQVVLDIVPFTGQEINIQRRVARKAIRLLVPSLRDIDFGIVNRFITLCGRGKNYHEADLGEGLKGSVYGNRATISKGKIILSEDIPQLPVNEAIPLTIPGDVMLSHNWHVSSSKKSLQDRDWQIIDEIKNPNEAWIDWDKVELPLMIRGRVKGDKFCPYGLEGHSIKLSDFMINEKIPLAYRSGWPLVLTKDDIVWIPGYRIGHDFRVTSETRIAIHLELKRISG